MNTNTIGPRPPTEGKPTLGDRLSRDRKYKAFWAVFIVSCAALGFDKITGDHWVDVVGMVFGLYMVGNVGAHYSNRNRT